MNPKSKFPPAYTSVEPLAIIKLKGNTILVNEPPTYIAIWNNKEKQHFVQGKQLTTIVNATYGIIYKLPTA